MSPSDELSDRDRILIVAFLDGEMEEGESHEFAKRLEREPALAEALEAFAEVDFAQRRLREERDSPPVRWRPRRWLPLAAAAVFLLALGVWWRSGGEPQGLRPRVAIVPSGRSLVELGGLVGIPAEEVPDLPSLRGAGSDLGSEAWRELRDRAVAFVQRLERLLDERASAALDDGRLELRAHYFAIAFEASRDSSAVVVHVGPMDLDSSRVERAFPPSDPIGAPPPLDRLRFAGGQVHVLHGELAEALGDGTGESLPDWNKGFYVPRSLVESSSAPREMFVLLGLREALIDGPFLEELDAVLRELDATPEARAGSPEELAALAEARLVERGFEVTRMSVTEPAESK